MSPPETRLGAQQQTADNKEEDPVSKYLPEIGKKGAQARAKVLSPEQRKEIAKEGREGLRQGSQQEGPGAGQETPPEVANR